MRTRFDHRLVMAVALTLAGLAGTRSAPADPITWPIFSDGSFGYFSPTPPTDGSSTSLFLGGNVPFRCATVAEATVLDSSHVTFTLSPNPACNDSFPVSWGAWFDLGRLAAGPHQLEIRRRIVWPDGHVTEEAASHAYVVEHAEPPPPPPHSTIFFSVHADPVAPREGEPVRLDVTGRFPYLCGELVDARVVSPTDVRFTLRPRSSTCPESTATWAQSFALGSFARGDYVVKVRASIEGAGDFTADTLSFGLHVRPDDPPPPPGEGRIRASWTPEHPTTEDPVVLTAHGMFSSGCGQVLGSRIVDLHHAEVNVRDNLICASPPRPWEQAFALGVLPAGRHDIRVWVNDDGNRQYPVDSVWVTIEVDEADVDSLPSVLGVSSPNPFRDESRFSISLNGPTPVDLGVFDLNGRRVATVHRGVLPAGRSQMKWNGRGHDGRHVASGIYFYRLVLPGRVESKRVVLLAHP